jgi:hypothetical protein
VCLGRQASPFFDHLRDRRGSVPKSASLCAMAVGPGVIALVPLRRSAAGSADLPTAFLCQPTGASSRIDMCAAPFSCVGDPRFALLGLVQFFWFRLISSELRDVLAKLCL